MQRNIEVLWYDRSNSIILQKYSGSWTWEDFDEAINRMFELMRNAPQRVDTIADARLFPQMPDTSLLPRLQRIWFGRLLPGNMGTFYVVGGSSIGLRLMATFQQVVTRNKLQFICVRSVEQALLMISQRAACPNGISRKVQVDDINET